MDKTNGLGSPYYTHCYVDVTSMDGKKREETECISKGKTGQGCLLVRNSFATYLTSKKDDDDSNLLPRKEY